MTHLSPDERLALIEAADAPDHPHLAMCARCRAEVDEGRATLGEARSSEVPDPSPLFWAHLSDRVSGRLAAEPAAAPRPRVGWRVLVPAAVGVTGVILAVWIGRGAIGRPAAPVPAVAAETTIGAVGDDQSWSMLVELAGGMDVDTLSDSLGTSEAAGSAKAVYQLNAREQASLAELLRAELGQAGTTE
jgi:hypothetical protein